MAAPAAYSRRTFTGNAAATTVPLGLSAAAGSCALASATNWSSGAGGPFLVVIDRGLNTEELAWSSGVSGSTLTFSLRGAQGTTAVIHAAGCSIALAAGVQDLDEANQVTAAVLGQSGAAKGDIPVMLSAAGPNTLTRLALGGTGTNIGVGGSGLPVYEVVPGRLLATQQYAPASLATYNLSTSLAALDTTNLTLAFTVPTDGNVDVDAMIYFILTAGATNICIGAGLLNHSGGAQLGNTVNIFDSQAAFGELQLARMRFHLTGLTPGALQVDLAMALNSTASASSASAYAQGYTGAPNSAKAGPALIQAFAA